MVKMGTVWDRTAEFLTDNLGAVLPIALIAYFVPASIDGSFAELRSTGSFQLQAILTVVSLLVAVLSIWGSLTISAMTLFPSGAEQPGAIARARLLPALAVSVAIFLAIVALGAPIGIALVAGGVDLAALGAPAQVDIPPAVGWFVLCYLLVLVCAILWLAARFAVLATPVIVAERRMFGALPRAWDLSRGLTWPIIGVILLYGIVATVAGLATKLVFGSVFTLIAGPANGLSLSGVLTSVMVAAVQTVFMLIAPVFAAKLYLAIQAARPAAASIP